MKKVTFKLILILSILSMINIFTIRIFAGMADMDDEQSDIESRKEIENQSKQDEQNAGKSSNNYLRSLEVEGYTLTPKFDKQIINYELEEETTKDSINIKAICDDEKAEIVSQLENIELQSGKNNIKIEIKAENGLMRTYFIDVKKKVDNNNLKISSLSLSKVNSSEKFDLDFSPSFNEDVFEYFAEVDSDITRIDCQVKTTIDCDVKIQGNENLKEGNNIIDIILTDKNNKTTTYKIIVTKKAESLATSAKVTDTKKTKKIAIAIVIVIIVIILLIVVLSLKNKKKTIKH